MKTKLPKPPGKNATVKDVLLWNLDCQLIQTGKEIELLEKKIELAQAQIDQIDNNLEELKGVK